MIGLELPHQRKTPFFHFLTISCPFISDSHSTPPHTAHNGKWLDDVEPPQLLSPMSAHELYKVYSHFATSPQHP